MLLTGSLLVLGAGSMLSRPVPAAVGAPPEDLAAESVTFRSDSGSTIHGWFSQSAHANGVVLLLPGVRANRLSMVDRATFLRSAGYSVLLIDFQATGESPDEAITFGWRERLDVLAATRFIRTRAPGQRVGVIGSSLGGAAAVLATPQLRVDAMVLEVVYPSVERAVKNRLRMRFGSAGELLAPLLLLQLKPRMGVTPQVLRPNDRIAEIGCPVLVIGGANDQHTTATDTISLYRAAPEPKQLWMIPGVEHVDFHASSKNEYEARILRFLSEALHKTRPNSA